MSITNTDNLVQYTITSALTTSTVYAYNNRLSALTDIVVKETTQTAALTDVTVNRTTDTFNKTSHGLSDGDVVVFNGTAIDGFTADTDYYVINKTADTFQLSATSGGSLVDATGSGTVAVTTLERGGAQPLVRTLVKDTDYTITPTYDGTLITSVNISPTASALNAGKFATTSTITIYRETDFQQGSNYEPNAIIPADTLEGNLDKLTMMAQQLRSDISRSVRFAESVVSAPDPEITFDASTRANKVLGFDADGAFAVTQELGTYVGDWTDGTTYQTRDIVRTWGNTSDANYGSLWSAKQTHVADSAANAPDNSAPLASNAYWELILDTGHFATKAALAETSSGLAESWASKTDGIVDSTDYSAKAYAIGGTGVTGAAGAAKQWATTTGGTVDGTEYSAKEYATGTNVPTGSAKEWANTAEDTQVTTGQYSALHYNAKAQAAKTAAEDARDLAVDAKNDAVTAKGLAEGALTAIRGFYLGAKASNPSVDDNGDPITEGDWYFNTGDNTTRIYNGSSWDVIEALPQALDTTDSPTFATVNATTVDSTNLEVTNIKAKDGTSAGSIADSTGVVTLASLDVSAGTLTLADNQISGDKIDGGTISNFASTGIDDNLTSGGPALTIDADGATTIDVSSTSDALRVTQTGTGNALVVEDSTNPDSTPFVVDNGGAVIRGHTSNVFSTGIQSVSTSVGAAAISVGSFSASALGAPIRLYHSRSGAVSTNTILQSDDEIAKLEFYGADGAGYIQGAAITAKVDGTPGTNDMPGRLVFSTTADNASTPTERMRIDSSGNVLVGTTDSLTTVSTKTTGDGIAIGTTGNYIAVARSNESSAATSLVLNRTSTSDGNVQSFKKKGTTVGSIGINGGALYIGDDSQATLRFGASSNAVYPADSSGTLTDNTMNLGGNALAFKDLWLGGGVVFGTTGGSVTSKTLDDYEEGTFTLTGKSSGGTTLFTSANQPYQKIGNRCFVEIYLNNSTGTNATTFEGLPFAASGTHWAPNSQTLSRLVTINNGDDFITWSTASNAGQTIRMQISYQTV